MITSCKYLKEFEQTRYEVSARDSALKVEVLAENLRRPICQHMDDTRKYGWVCKVGRSKIVTQIFFSLIT